MIEHAMDVNSAIRHCIVRRASYEKSAILGNFFPISDG